MAAKKGKRLTIRLDNELDSIIEQACIEGECGKTSIVLNILRKGFGLDEAEDDESAESKAGPAAKGYPYDANNEKTGGIDRFDRNGKLIFHFKPLEMKNGIQYYKDTMGDNPNKKWRKDSDGNWIQTVKI